MRVLTWRISAAAEAVALDLLKMNRIPPLNNTGQKGE
jgi:hypothetical protein